MAVDLKNLNQNQLNDLITKAEQRKLEIEKQKLTKLRERIQKMIKACTTRTGPSTPPRKTNKPTNQLNFFISTSNNKI